MTKLEVKFSQDGSALVTPVGGSPVEWPNDAVIRSLDSSGACRESRHTTEFDECTSCQVAQAFAKWFREEFGLVVV